MSEPAVENGAVASPEPPPAAAALPKAPRHGGRLANLRSFPKGTSGNPGGRPRAVRAVRDLARQYTETAVTTLVEICTKGKMEAARVSAAAEILNRGWGRAPLAIVGDPDAPLAIELTSADRRATAARLVAEAFAEIAARAPPPPELPAPAPPMIEAIPAPAAEGNGKAVAVVPVNIARAARPIPFAQRYGRRLNHGY